VDETLFVDAVTGREAALTELVAAAGELTRRLKENSHKGVAQLSNVE
jgi:hypothetical protein